MTMHDATTASTRDEGVAPPTEPRQTAPAYRSDAAWLALLASYRQPDRRRSVFELVREKSLCPNLTERLIQLLVTGRLERHQLRRDPASEQRFFNHARLPEREL